MRGHMRTPALSHAQLAWIMHSLFFNHIESIPQSFTMMSILQEYNHMFVNADDGDQSGNKSGIMGAWSIKEVGYGKRANVFNRLRCRRV